ncbi:MAG TPA: type II toxin-antitoxin system HicB family antitoxin [Gemmatimonadaceae bacterium]|jgi:predicted HicB family RNase H-like nuclease|nr:type II toxin-antitoxin system HicB family antitoxin [Gemmatimonadaceae bacterium]
MMEYKGYTGIVEFDADDHILHGRVLGLKDTITFEGASVKEVERAFRASVDDYLSWCAERSEEPDRPFSGKFVVRLEPDLHRAIAAAAARAHASLNAWAATQLARAAKQA